ncbi:MAG: hypothetical protein SGARI_005305 [Bacillariaceae sp.]
MEEQQQQQTGEQPELPDFDLQDEHPELPDFDLQDEEVSRAVDQVAEFYRGYLRGRSHDMAWDCDIKQEESRILVEVLLKSGIFSQCVVDFAGRGLY